MYLCVRLIFLTLGMFLISYARWFSTFISYSTSLSSMHVVVWNSWKWPLKLYLPHIFSVAPCRSVSQLVMVWNDVWCRSYKFAGSEAAGGCFRGESRLAVHVSTLHQCRWWSEPLRLVMVSLNQYYHHYVTDCCGSSKSLLCIHSLTVKHLFFAAS